MSAPLTDAEMARRELARILEQTTRPPWTVGYSGNQTLSIMAGDNVVAFPVTPERPGQPYHSALAEREANEQAIVMLRNMALELLRDSHRASDAAKRAEEAEAERDKLREEANRLRQDRFDALAARTTCGMSAAEWQMRTGKAERERREAQAETLRMRGLLERCRGVVRLSSPASPLLADLDAALGAEKKAR